jgi:hypothetical protein
MEVGATFGEMSRSSAVSERTFPRIWIKCRVAVSVKAPRARMRLAHPIRATRAVNICRRRSLAVSTAVDAPGSATPRLWERHSGASENHLTPTAAHPPRPAPAAPRRAFGFSEPYHALVALLPALSAWRRARVQGQEQGDAQVPVWTPATAARTTSPRPPGDGRPGDGRLRGHRGDRQCHATADSASERSQMFLNHVKDVGDASATGSDRQARGEGGHKAGATSDIGKPGHHRG